MPNTATADRLSLTLPDWRAALKRRVRRPRKPDFWTTYYLLGALIAGGCALQDLLDRDYGQGTVMLCVCGLWWKAWQHRRAGRRAQAARCITVIWAVTAIGLFVG